MNGMEVTPASDNLFEIDMVANVLDYKTVEYFHQMTAWLLFASKRAQPDIKVAVAFLCTRVKEPNVNDYQISPRNHTFTTTDWMEKIRGTDLEHGCIIFSA